MGRSSDGSPPIVPPLKTCQKNWPPFFIRQIIAAKLRIENYARCSAIVAKLCAEKYAVIASEQKEKMIYWFWNPCGRYYSKDKDGNCYQTQEDEVIQVTTEEQL